MHDNPTAAELVAGVRRFLEETAGPQLTGHAAFMARVSINALATVERELAARETNDAAEFEGLAKLLGDDDATLDALQRRLCDEIRSGALDIATPGLFAHLKSTTIRQVQVDQPRYSGLATALEQSE